MSDDLERQADDYFGNIPLKTAKVSKSAETLGYVLSPDELHIVETAEEHVHFCRNIDTAAYSNIIIKDLIKIIKKYTKP